MKKRVAIFSYPFWPMVGGLEKNTDILSRTLVDAGFDVTVITASALGDADELKVSYNIARNWTVSEMVKQVFTASFVVVNGGVSILPCALARVLGKRTICIYQMAVPILKLGGSWKQALLNSLRRFGAGGVSDHVFVSQACADAVGPTGSGVRHVIRNPVDPSLEELASIARPYDEREIDVLYLGRLIRGKGVYEMLQALRLLDAQPGVRLTVRIVGEGPEMAGILECAERMARIDVSVSPAVHGADLAQLFANSKLLLIPSTTHIEGSPLVIAEAFAFGVPVMGASPNQPAIVETMGTGGVEINAREPSAIAARISEWFSNPLEQERLHHEAQRRAPVFEYQSYRLQILGLFHTTLG